MLKILRSLLVSAFALTASAQTATVTICGADGKFSTKETKLEKLADGSLRLFVPKAEIPESARYIEATTDFSFAQKGEDGYIVFPRGDLCKFRFDSGKFEAGRMVMPFIGMKTPRSTFWAHIKGMRHECVPTVKIENGKYTASIRCNINTTGFGAYEDFIIEYRFLKGDDANYAGMGRAYRKYQIDNGVVKPVKDRIKTQPFLEYMAKSVPIRIQYHGAKKREDKDFTPETETPVIPVLDFEKSIEFVDALKKAGVGEITFCSAGWQSGGYDGRFPQLFPIPEELGGEATLRKFIRHTKDSGYMIHAHTNSTDCYKCSRLWSADIVAKNPDGALQRGHFWCGGRAYNLCARNAWETFLPEQLKKVHEIGFQAPHYIDVFSAIPPYFCADAKHPANREQMAECQRKILSYCHIVFGGAASEGGYDHVAGQLDYVNYISARMSNWYKLKRGEKTEKFYINFAKFIDEYVPLWEIVYHGIILSNPDRFTQNHTTGKPKTDDSGDLRFNERDGIQDPVATLRLVEFGGRPIFYTSNFKDIPNIKKAYDEFLPLRHLQLELMQDHKYLTLDVSLTIYGDGEEVVCNYGKTDFEYKGKKISPLGYALFKQ